MTRHSVRIVLVRVRNPLNIGAAARAMSNFGFGTLRVVNSYEVAFREARSAVDASEVLSHAEQYSSVAEAIADCTLVVGTTAVGHRELKHQVRRLEEAGEIISQQAGPMALLFGSEKTGLSNDDLAYCHWLLRIPTREEHFSMNLGQAVAVCLYELVRRSNTVLESETAQAAPAGILDLTTGVLTEALYRNGYMTAEAVEATKEKVRRLMRRLNLSKEDAETLLGIVRHISRG
ncbi:MAG: RNA methyltransferase [Terriglobales bacterium]